MGINIFFFCVYVLAPFANLNNTVAYKFADSIKDITEKAQAFQIAAGQGESSNGFLKKAELFGSAGKAEKFKKFGESLASASTGSCDLLKTNAKEFEGAVEEFKGQAETFKTAAGNQSDGFLEKAQLFKQAAEAIPDITTEVKTKNETVLKLSKVQDAIKIFKLAASVFGDDSTGAAKKFQEFAEALAEQATSDESKGANCYKLFGMIDELKTKAQEFQEAADGSNGFQAKATTFSSSGGHEAFNAMAGAFREAADKLKILAEALAAAYADTGINDKAVAFRAKVVEFHRYATEFEVAAKLVTQADNNDLTKVKDSFASGSGKFAYIFGDENAGAAKKLYEAFSAFTSELTKRESCTQLTSAVLAFQQAVDQGASGFKHHANEFQNKANQIDTGKLGSNPEAKSAIQQFQNAAQKFGNKGGDVNTVAKKLSTFATALNEKAGQSEKCYKLLMHADKFAKASVNFTVYAQLFQTAARAFKAKADYFGSAYAAAWRFRKAATDFYNATSYLKALAEKLAIDLSGTPLSEEVNGFRTQADLFYNDSRLFYYLAQQVTKDIDLDKIKTAFQEAAQKFSQAAEKFGHQTQAESAAAKFKDFATELENVSEKCTLLTGKKGEFTKAAGLFQNQATEFNAKVQEIPDITVTVTYLTGITVAGQTVAPGDGNATIKPSRVQHAISQFKLTAAKFHTAASYFQTLAETFGKQDNNSAATKLGEFANTLKTNGCNKEIKSKATAFKDKADLFYTHATQFQLSS